MPDPGFFPGAAQVKEDAHPEWREVGQGIPEPEAHIAHIQIDAEQDGQAQSQDETVKEGCCKVYFGIAAAVNEGIHGRPAGTAEKAEDANGDIFYADTGYFRVIGKYLKNFYRPGVQQDRKKDSQRNGDAEDGPDNLIDPFVPGSSDVLPYHGRSGCIDGIGNKIGCYIETVGHSGKCGNGYAIGINP